MERHRFDIVSFVFGAIFAAIAIIGLTDVFWLRPVDLRWLAPGVLVVLGLLLVLTSGRGRHGAPPTDQEPAVEPAQQADTPPAAEVAVSPDTADDGGPEADGR